MGIRVLIVGIGRSIALICSRIVGFRMSTGRTGECPFWADDEQENQGRADQQQNPPITLHLVSYPKRAVRRQIRPSKGGLEMGDGSRKTADEAVPVEPKPSSLPGVFGAWNSTDGDLGYRDLQCPNMDLIFQGAWSGRSRRTRERIRHAVTRGWKILKVSKSPLVTSERTKTKFADESLQTKTKRKSIYSILGILFFSNKKSLLLLETTLVLEHRLIDVCSTFVCVKERKRSQPPLNPKPLQKSTTTTHLKLQSQRPRYETKNHPMPVMKATAT